MTMRISRLLAFRLFVTLFVVMTAGTALFTQLMVDRQEAQFTDRAISTAFRLSDIIKNSMRYSMMLNRREDLYHTITTIGNEPGIRDIRLYNKRGVITFSSDSAQVGTLADLTDAACRACHGTGHPPTNPQPRELYRIFETPTRTRVLGMITPIHNDRSCSEAECHAHPSSQTVLGILDVMLPLDDVDAALAESVRSQYLYGLLLVIVVLAASGVFLYILVNRPVHNLTYGTEEIIKGNLDHRIPVTSHDEIGVLAASFNRMTDELRRAREENLHWTRTLEERVLEKTDELRRAQNHLIHVEKMASLGKLAATVAHELNNPLAGVLTYAKLLRKKIAVGTVSDEDQKEIQSELTLIADESARCGNIVKNLLLFSRQKVGELKTENFAVIVERSLKLIDHHMRIHNITAQTDFMPPQIPLHCDPQQIEQALLALEINAIEAMPDGGTLRITGRADASSIRIEVSDTGIGIAEHDLPMIFEPFFTTKEHEKGTGLGLSVVYGIVERHGGTITVQSRKGEGAVFTILLPLQPAAAHHDPSSTNGQAP